MNNMKLEVMLAKACHYAQDHISCADGWPMDEDSRTNMLQCTSYMVACFLAQNTVVGHKGVDWDVVIEPLIEILPACKTEKQWLRIIRSLVNELGGWKKSEEHPVHCEQMGR